MVYNFTDKTWAQITAFVSTAQVTLSQNIMAKDEGYRIYNQNCYKANQLDFSNVDDYVRVKHVEYPYGTKRNAVVLDRGHVLEIIYDGVINDTDPAQSTSYRDTLVTLETIHRLPNMTDLALAVNNSAGYAIGATSMAMDAGSGTETIPQHALFTIATVRGTYRATAAVSLSAGTGVVGFYPPLLDAAVNDDVVTIVGNSLSPELEEAYADLVAAQLLYDRANEWIPNLGKDYFTFGLRRKADALSTIRGLASTRDRGTYTYPRL